MLGNLEDTTKKKEVKEKQETAFNIDFNKRRIEELKAPMQKLLTEMRTLIEGGSYSLIIGIDASARIPTLIINKVIRHVYSKKKYKTPKTIFLPGDLDKIEEMKEDEIKKYIESFVRKGEDILIIEDSVARGNSIKKLAQLLDEMGFCFDVATIGLIMGSISLNDPRDKWGRGIRNFFVGQKGASSVCNNSSVSGVARNSFLVPHRIIKDGEEISTIRWPSQVVRRQTVVSAREEVDSLSNELIKWYDSKGVLEK